MLNSIHSIIQDCEDALTNWVQQNAAVSSKLSTRARTLSQRRREGRRQQGEGLDLSTQDQPMDHSRGSGLWIPATEHQAASENQAYSYQQEEEDDDDEEHHSAAANGEQRGREEERQTA